jgi:hypothetical protein
MSKLVHVEHLYGRNVRDSAGKVAGRIESIRAHWRGKDCVVEEYHLGAAALLERLGMRTLGLFGWTLMREPLRVPWEMLDLSDPNRPRLRCTIEELRKSTP